MTDLAALNDADLDALRLAVLLEHGAGGLWREAAEHLHEVKDNMTKEESDALGDAGIQDLLDDARPGRAGTSRA